MLTCVLIMAFCATFIALRLLPQHFQQGTAWGILWPMMAAGLARAFEIALLTATPLGFALATLREHEPWKAQSAGSSAWSAKLVQIAPALAWFVIAGALGAYVSLRWNAPAGIARDVIQASRRDCIARHGRKVDAIPLIGARWVCDPSTAPRLVGEISKLGRATRYSAKSIDLSSDLSYIDLAELSLVTPAGRGSPSLRLTVEDARLRGLLPWVNSGRFRGVGRAFYIAGASVIIALFDALTLLRRVPRRRFSHPLAAFLSGVIAWYCVGVADAQLVLPAVGYLAVPFIAVAAQMAIWLGIERLALLTPAKSRHAVSRSDK
jgi:hypothetical protein